MAIQHDADSKIFSRQETDSCQSNGDDSEDERAQEPIILPPWAQ